MKTARKAMAMMVSENNNVAPDARLSSDRLSGLQDSIIFHIFSFLDFNDTFRLSLVSRKFKQLCLRSPCLFFLADFDADDADGENYYQNSQKNKLMYTQFCNYVDNVMRSRCSLGVEIDTFFIHWFSKYYINEGYYVIASWVRAATNGNVRELDILLHLDYRIDYCLPDSVFGCQSLRVLRLNLQMGSLILEGREMESVQELVLGSVTIRDAYFGQKISQFWVSLKRLNLVKVCQTKNLKITSESLEELKISNSQFGSVHADWHLTINSSSLKSISISRCHFTASSHMNLDCPSLENFGVIGSKFDRVLISAIIAPLLGLFGLLESYLKKSCYFCIYCPSVKHLKISSCTFEEFCQFKIDSSSIEDLTIWDCQLIRPRIKIYDSDLKRRIIFNTEKLERLTLHSSDKYLYEFPLSISAPCLRNIRWRGSPVDFSHLEDFLSLENAAIDIEPSCQHKSRELACCCKLFKSSIYCVSMLLQSLKYAKILKINIWPIEMFFMQNNDPICFDNLLHLILMADDSLAEQLPVIASFLKGLPKLRTLFIECEMKSNVLGDPSLISSLGLCPESFNLSLSEDWKKTKIEKITAQAPEDKPK